jgi:amidase
MDADYTELDATALAELVRSGEASPSELVDEAIGRIEKLNPQLNAVIHERFDKARVEATSGSLPSGPFRGVPMVVKDLDGPSAGDPYYAGMRFLKEHGWTADEDAYQIAKLRAAGFVFVGKTNCPELGLVPTTEPESYGPTRNPWDVERSPGGSSGGSAAAVASRMVPVGHAGDGGGSIRIPASQCGLVGLKPSRGRVSVGREHGEWWAGLVVRGAVTRTVRDSAALLDVMAGPMPGDPYYAAPPERPFAEEVGRDPGTLRIGYDTVAPGGLAITQPDCETAVHATTELLASLGHEVEDSRPQTLQDDAATQHGINVIGSWVAYELDRWSAKTGTRIGPTDVELSTWNFAEIGRGVTTSQYLEAVHELHSLTRQAAQWWADGFDVLVTPTIPEPPHLLGEFTATPENPLQGVIRSGQIVAFAAPVNVSGQPAVSLPLHWTENGLPVGVQLVAASGREDLLIRVASQLEEARPWADRRPPVS